MRKKITRLSRSSHNILNSLSRIAVDHHSKPGGRSVTIFLIIGKVESSSPTFFFPMVVIGDERRPANALEPLSVPLEQVAVKSSEMIRNFWKRWRTGVAG